MSLQQNSRLPAEDRPAQAENPTKRNMITIFGMCIDLRVVGGLAAAAMVLFTVAPNLVLSALPYLLVAACPLSMLLMGKGMMGMGGQAAQPGAAGQFACSMHPEVRSEQAGRCPRCGMELAPTALPRQAQEPQTAGTGAALTREEQLAQLRAQLQSVSEQQAALARQIEQVLPAEAAVPPTAVGDTAVREAEAVARAADERTQRRS